MQIAALTGSLGRSTGIARGEAGQTAAPAAVEKPQEPYLSPVFKFDKQARVVVFQFRDSETGDVTRQWPSEKVVKLYRDNAPKAATEASPLPVHVDEEPETADAKSSEGSGDSEAAKSAAGDTGGTERVQVTV